MEMNGEMKRFLIAQWLQSAGEDSYKSVCSAFLSKVIVLSLAGHGREDYCHGGLFSTVVVLVLTN